jgi:hypothetical protein
MPKDRTTDGDRGNFEDLKRQQYREPHRETEPGAKQPLREPHQEGGQGGQGQGSGGGDSDSSDKG